MAVEFDVDVLDGTTGFAAQDRNAVHQRRGGDQRPVNEHRVHRRYDQVAARQCATERALADEHRAKVAVGGDSFRTVAAAPDPFDRLGGTGGRGDQIANLEVLHRHFAVGRRDPRAWRVAEGLKTSKLS